MEEPKKRRRLLIIDVEGDGTAYTGPTAVAAPAPVELPGPWGPGPIHGRTQQEILRLCKESRFDEEKIEARIWIKVDQILKATTPEQADKLVKDALQSASMYFIMNRTYPEKQAKAAERLAKMHHNKGEDEKAKAQLEKAKKIRAAMKAEAENKQ